jgi:hypothetical protein
MISMFLCGRVYTFIPPHLGIFIPPLTFEILINEIRDIPVSKKGSGVMGIPFYFVHIYAEIPGIPHKSNTNLHW